MLVAGNYNVLLGAGAQLPDPSAAGSHQIVIGSSDDIVYLGAPARRRPAASS